MNTTAVLIIGLVCAMFFFGVRRLRRIRWRPIQRTRVARMSAGDLREELGISLGFALRRLEGGVGSIVSPEQFWRCIDTAAILRQRMAALDGLAPLSERAWRKIVLDDLRQLRARRLAAGLPGLPARPIHGNRAALTRWVALAVAGKKTMVCWPLREVPTMGMTRLGIGERAVYVTQEGDPLLAVECVGAELRRFEDIDSDIALAEGEHDTLDAWREDRRKTFAARVGWRPGLRIVCERIRVIDKFGQ